MASVLAELDVVIGGGGGTSGTCTGATPIVDAATAILGADDPYLLSGTSLRCSNGTETATRRVYRLTPRCLDGGSSGCSTRPTVKGGAPAIIKIGSGFEARPVADGCWYTPASNVSSVGYWIVAPC